MRIHAFAAVPGKEALGFVNEFLQTNYDIGITAAAIIDAMKPGEVPVETVWDY
jgi:hypothetical protein